LLRYTQKRMYLNILQDLDPQILPETVGGSVIALDRESAFIEIQKM